MLLKLEKDIDDVDAKMWRLLDRYVVLLCLPKWLMCGSFKVLDSKLSMLAKLLILSQ